MQPDHLQLLLDNRLAKHRAAEYARQEAERERIRAEERAKAEREARARVEAERRAEAARQQAEDERQREAARAQAAEDDRAIMLAEQKRAPVAVAPATAPATGPLIKLGEINARIGPLSITAAGLAELGFEPARQDGASKLYHAADFGRMCHAMAQRLTTAALPA